MLCKSDATAHKIDVNSDVSGICIAENTAKSNQKMVAPQLYEQLQSDCIEKFC